MCVCALDCASIVPNVQVAGADHRVGVLGVIYALFDSTPPQWPLPSTALDQAAAEKSEEEKLLKPIQVHCILSL